MLVWIAWGIAAVSTAACLWLWFRDVRRVMEERKRMVESAAAQLAFHKKQAAPGDEAGAAVVQRSASILAQAADIYNAARQSRRYRLPAAVMGYPMLGRDGRPLADR